MVGAEATTAPATMPSTTGLTTLHVGRSGRLITVASPVSASSGTISSGRLPAAAAMTAHSASRANRDRMTIRRPHGGNSAASPRDVPVMPLRMAFMHGNR
ncbi:unannotated protein [freshwater metagenome]|uniref:Unannotated protein n=1 Tax=freshwater metagenome TaxID=449393 RepID=A0A6J7RCR7_9ZZZZ